LTGEEIVEEAAMAARALAGEVARAGAGGAGGGLGGRDAGVAAAFGFRTSREAREILVGALAAAVRATVAGCVTSLVPRSGRADRELALLDTGLFALEGAEVRGMILAMVDTTISKPASFHRRFVRADPRAQSARIEERRSGLL